MKRLVRGWARAVRFIGYLDRAEGAAGLLRGADVFVFASRTERPRAWVLLEAMAASLPVVALAEMGTVDILGPRRASLARRRSRRPSRGGGPAAG